MLFQKAFKPNRLLIRGIIAIIIGITIFVVPDFSLKLMMHLLGALLVADALIAFVADYYATKKKTEIVPRGISNFVIGLILLIFPTLLVNIFVFVLGLLLIFAGATQLINQFGYKGKFSFSWFMAIISAIAIIAGVILIAHPFESAQSVLMLFGAVLLVYGVGEIIWSFKIRTLQKENESSVVDTPYEEVQEVDLEIVENTNSEKTEEQTQQP